MAELVAAIGMTHNPFMPTLLARSERPPGAASVWQHIELLREALREARPDALLMVGNDHLNQFFMDNMPAFLIGKMARYVGTFPNEEREFGIPTCAVAGDAELARHLLEGGLGCGVDFAYSDELRLDHSIVVPLLFLRPELDLPIVPVLTNCIAPPLPTARRFHQVGQALRAAIELAPIARRVVLVASGHLSLEVGGPRQFEAQPVDPEFDSRAADWIRRGDVAAASEACTYAEMRSSGNMTHGFLNFLLAMGAAERLCLAHAEAVRAGFPSVPVFSWSAGRTGENA
jgi:protocatechuate 4,5-dioxygenase beta chain